MTNLFLKVNKDLFTMGLNPTEILLLAQIEEFNRNTNDCFMSNKAFAELLGVSESTIKRELDKLESMGFITRETKNAQKGKERHIKVDLNKIEEKLARVNLNLVNENKNSAKVNLNLAESSKCTLRKGQNDLIKDNIKEIKEKDNLEVDFSKEEGTIANPIEVNREWLVERRNELVTLSNGFFKYGNKFYKLGG